MEGAEDEDAAEPLVVVLNMREPILLVFGATHSWLLVVVVLSAQQLLVLVLVLDLTGKRPRSRPSLLVVLVNIIECNVCYAYINKVIFMKVNLSYM